MRTHKVLGGNKLSGFFVSLIFLLCILFPSGCIDDSQSGSPAGPSDSASASLMIRWHDDTLYSKDSATTRALPDCQTAGIDQVVCHVYDTASGDLLVTGGPWNCSDNVGTIDLIPVGQDRTFVALAEDIDGNVIYQGETTGVAINANETAEVEINAYPFVPTLVSPDDGDQVAPDDFSLEWEPLENAEEYLVQVAEDIDFETIIIDETTPGTTYAPANLALSTEYFWRIGGIDIYTNIGTESEVRSFVISDGPVISGAVLDGGGAGISGVTVTFSNEGGTATTDSSGAYSITVPSGWSGTATPSGNGYSFSPESRDYSNVTEERSDENYTATTTTPVISGTVLDSGGSGISGVTLTFSNDGGTATTDPSGAYSITVPYGWSGTATPSSSSYTFSPLSRSYSNVTAHQSDQNYTATATTPVISGTVLDSGGSGVSGVTLTFSNDGGTATTDPSGAYSRAVPYGWSGTATPYSNAYNFSPSSRDYSNVTANQSDENYTATATTPVIAGYVRDGEGTGISGVTVTFSNEGGSVTTAESGAYSIAVPYGWSGSATPSSSCHSFNPLSRSYSNVTADQTSEHYTGTLNTYAISGYVRDSEGAAISGVTVTFSNDGGSATTDSSGFYSRYVPCGWSGTATPSSSAYSFVDPSYRSYSNVTANFEDQDYTGWINTYSISGYVRDSEGAGISGVTLTFSNDGGTATTDSYGYYSRFISYGWSGTVTPSSSCYSFSPSNRSYTSVATNLAGQNYTATQYTYSISGYVRDSGGTGIGGITMTFSNGGGTATTSSSGYYSRYVPCGWSGTVSPSSSCYSFSPSYRSYTSVATDYTSQDFTATQYTFYIYGYVRNSNGVGISDVTMTFSNKGGTATTNSNGYYSRGVPCGWSGTVTPSRTCYSFSPSYRSYSSVTANQSGQDYTATEISPYISGYVRDSGGTGISGVTMTFSNGGGTATTSSTGYYYRYLPCGWSGTVTPSMLHYTFSPPSRSYSSVTTNYTGQNYTGTGYPDLYIPSGSPWVSTTSVLAGQTVTLGDWTVRNQGVTASGSFSNGFYLSTNTIISRGDTYLGGNSNSSLAPGTKFTWGGPTLTIPVDTPVGYYYIGILVDNTYAITESSESNNYVATQQIYVYHLY